MTVVLAATGSGLEAVLDRLLTWSAAGYLAPFVWAHGDDSLRIEAGEITARGLSAALDGHSEGAHVIAIALPDEEGHIGAEAVAHLGRTQASFAAALSSSIPAAPAVVYFPLTDDTTIEPAPEGSVRACFVAVPEDQAGPLEANVFDATNPDRVAAHVAHATAALTGILGNSSPSLVAPAAEQTLELHHPPVSFVRCYSRVIDAGYLPDALASSVFSVSRRGRWPNPDYERFERTELDDELLAMLAARFVEAHAEELGPHAVETPDPSPERRLSLPEALKAIGRSILADVRRRPAAWVDERLERFWERRVVPTVENLYTPSGVKLAHWRNREPHASTALLISEQFSEPLPAADGATGPVWRDLLALAGGLIDGGPLPIRSPELQRGRFRALETRPSAIVPRFDDFPPLHLRPAFVCDPRTVEPLIDAEIAAYQAALEGQEADRIATYRRFRTRPRRPATSR